MHSPGKRPRYHLRGFAYRSLARGLQRILLDELGRALHLKCCMATVVAACAISRTATGDSVIHLGRPWSTAGALRCLAGMGYVFSPRDALRALALLEDTFIIDRRRLEWRRDNAGRRPSARRTPPPLYRADGRKRSKNRLPRSSPLIMGDGRYPLGYQQSR